MTAATTPSSLGWIAIPQPTTSVLTGGAWRPSTVRVVVDGRGLDREAARLERELTGLGVPSGDASIIRLSIAQDAPEAFAIEVGDDVTVRAGSAAGVFRATRQLLHNLRAQGFVPRGRVESSPVVSERGFHLDAARKHFPAEWIVELLHSLADVGINGFQWHLSENEGFRVASLAFPEITSTRHITREQATRIAEVAVDLHIDLVPSLDMPGHLRHVLSAHPELRLPDEGGPATDHALDITSEKAVGFALALIDDIAPLFPHSTRWNLGGDEFVDFARIDEYPALADSGGTGFDLLTGFVNRVAAHLRARGLRPRAWNDGMLRGEAAHLDPDVVLTWWTNWHAQMAPLVTALDRGHRVVNFHDGLFYYVLGEKAGYTYPTSRRIWDADWHPGLFPALPDGTRQEIAAPYPDHLLGAYFSVWSDDPEAQTPAEVAQGIRAPVRAMAERSWNGAGRRLSHERFRAIDASIACETGSESPGY